MVVLVCVSALGMLGCVRTYKEHVKVDEGDGLFQPVCDLSAVPCFLVLPFFGLHHYCQQQQPYSSGSLL